MVFLDEGGQVDLSVKKLKKRIDSGHFFEEEGDRIFYVATSRARRLLYLTSPDPTLGTLFL